MSIMDLTTLTLAYRRSRLRFYRQCRKMDVAT